MSSNSSSDEARDLAYAIMQQLWQAFKAEDVLKEITPALFERAQIRTLNQHNEHLGVHNIAESALDPYKYCCWFGCAVLSEVALIDHDDNDRCNFTKISNAVIRTLCGMIHIDSNKVANVPDRTIKLLTQMLREERKGNKDHGIWQNGLYAAFHTAVAVGNWPAK